MPLEINPTSRPLSTGWRLVLTGPDAAQTPHHVKSDDSINDAPVPGTVAEALEGAGRFNRKNPAPLDNQDAWYFLDLEETPGPATLHFGGLATICDIFFNGELLLQTDSMFLSQDLPVTLTGKDELALCFRALAPRLNQKGPRARWRTQLMNTQGLRLVRTTALGYMPGWCPEVHAVGPWRPVTISRPDAETISGIAIRARLSETGDGELEASFSYSGKAEILTLHCAGQQATCEQQNGDQWTARLTLSNIEPWWPHTHGNPTLHDVELSLDEVTRSLGRTGFRRIEVDRGPDGKGFALRINGEKIFCRGAVWSSADIVRLPGTRRDYEPWLKLAQEASMNMLRLSGITAYETPDFYALCDELGVMVWQDFMFANFDYPVKDEAFVRNVQAEARQLLAAVRHAPSLTVLCGGSEIYQQGAMVGLPEATWKGPLTEEILPAIANELCPYIPYVPNSPCGGALPFISNEGVSHYYGVSAYCRPLEDARRADVRFATECLAFSNVPEARTLKTHLDVPPVHDPRWKARVPRDRGVSWDFEDVRDAYLEMLYGYDPARLRREDAEQYLHLSRAVTAEVMEATFAEWRRPGSTCFGGLVWMFQDLLPGAGWGMIDATGEPKASWHGLKRAFRPQQLALTDEGVNGLAIHVLNEQAESADFSLKLACLRAGSQPVVSARREISIGGRSAITIPATDLFGAFFDITYAYRFGPPAHDVTVARLKRNDITIAEAFHFPLGRTKAFHDAAVEAVIVEENGNWFLDLTAPVLAQSVSIDAGDWRAAENWFHLAPNATKRVALIPRHETPQKPTGEIRIAGSSRIVWF
ncbi:beta-mannosidase [Ochrobactrum sp. J50]|jgi:beta-mannosidase|uniref:beta-mannosidase n=1 Tax=Brucella pseudintermedia TaxID=370111 RepID=A0ABY5UEF6_9HYPH|nr:MULTISPECIES: glycoside hydrolase family 2 protein [Brucella/Ochrobactrum group]NKE76676.1 glycoside hydrolase family 2 protein [Ochrobactrum sp. MC-1LL]TWH04031.1 beta-mannosidase [Ochrobactrum sp. J50]UWL61261.1 glycoside hydrolase family 2 protein [Brucella pseudintermedia]WPM79458.1 glycoside hydrolase family 2 protein [Brucella pseudintermedia]